MALITSVSGIRGTIGGPPGENLSPLDIVRFVSAYASWLKNRHPAPTVIIGRDGRISGSMVERLVVSTLMASGIDVINGGLSTTPTIEVEVLHSTASGGIVVTASHNPLDWNALKFLDEHGEFISSEAGREIIEIIEVSDFSYVPAEELGSVRSESDLIEQHVDKICALDLVRSELIESRNFHIVVDAIQSTGALAIPMLLDALGCTYTLINGTVNGRFAHPPEPLPEHLDQLMKAVPEQNADLGIAVDPDVDRLALVCEDGSWFGEEYTLVAAADYVLGKKKGAVVSNLSSTQALKDLAEKYGVPYGASAVGEYHVVQKMKAMNAVIGGEGNGGVILPELHYGRDALVGIALILSHLAEQNTSLSDLRSRYPHYEMSKDKLQLNSDMDVPTMLRKLSNKYSEEEQSREDGLKIYLSGENAWVHIRSSNTEPILRIYTEAPGSELARDIADRFKKELQAL